MNSNEFKFLILIQNPDLDFVEKQNRIQIH